MQLVTLFNQVKLEKDRVVVSEPDLPPLPVLPAEIPSQIVDETAQPEETPDTSHSGKSICSKSVLVFFQHCTNIF